LPISALPMVNPGHK